jgi:hypothetical protein
MIPNDSGVFFGKRINFYNFRNVALQLVARARGAMDIKHLIEFLNNANVAVRNKYCACLLMVKSINCIVFY